MHWLSFRVARAPVWTVDAQSYTPAMQITYLNWGNRKSVAGTRVLGGRRETLEAENLGAAVMLIQPKPRKLLRPCLAQSGMQESGLGNARSNAM